MCHFQKKMIVDKRMKDFLGEIPFETEENY